MIEWCYRYRMRHYAETGEYPAEVFLTFEQRDKLWEELRSSLAFVSHDHSAKGHVDKIYDMKIKLMEIIE